MRALLAVSLVASACGFHAPSTQVPDDGPHDGPNGMEKPPDDASNCFGSILTVCLKTLPDSPLAFGVDTPLNTDTAACVETTNSAASGYCVLAGKGIAVTGDHAITAQGGKPLVLLSTTTIDVTGTIDVSSHHDNTPQNTGAGGNPSGACNGFSIAQGGSGGAGGSFGGKGGNGEARGGTAGQAAAALTSPPAALRGGCPGGAGGTSGGVGGSGGGAVALIAVTKITLDGTLNACGGGGNPGTSGGMRGGGGGGSGGMIVLDAPTLSVTGTSSIFANGGGGGQGGSGPAAGDPGGESAGPTTAALRGNKTTVDGGSGGNGSFGTAMLDGSDPTGNAQMSGGGGAGGGGSGFIRATQALSANVAPAPL